MNRKLAVASLFMLVSFALQAAPAAKVLGPELKENFFQIGNQRLKLRALLVETVDANAIVSTVNSYVNQPGTHDFSWKIGYSNLPAQQAAVLSWYNLDSKENGWIAVAHDASGNWFKMSNRKTTWADFKDTHIIRKDTTNGYDIVSRVSKTGAGAIAYAFSREMR